MSILRIQPWHLVASVLCSLSMAVPCLAQDITLGQVGPFTNAPPGNGPEAHAAGIEAALQAINKQGGVRGHKLVLQKFDSQYTPEGMRAAFEKASSDKKVSAIVIPLGTMAVSYLLDKKLLDTGNALILNPVPGVEPLRSPGHPMMFHVRAGDKQQIEKLINHVHTVGMTRVSVLYADQAGVVPSTVIAKDEAARLGGGMELKLAKAAPEDPAAMANASKEVAAQGPQGVVILGSPRFAADAIGGLRAAGVTQPLFVLSYVPVSLIVKSVGVEGARGVGIAQTYPNPNAEQLPMVRAFRQAMEAVHPEIKVYEQFHLEGYVVTLALAEALRRSKENDTSPQGVARALKSAGEMDLGGFRVDFSKGNVGSRFVDIGVIGSSGKLVF